MTLQERLRTRIAELDELQSAWALERIPEVALFREAVERIDALEAALAPFARVAELIAISRPGWDHDDFALAQFDAVEMAPIATLAPFRRAKALLEAK